MDVFATFNDMLSQVATKDPICRSDHSLTLPSLIVFQTSSLKTFFTLLLIAGGVCTIRRGCRGSERRTRIYGYRWRDGGDDHHAAR